MCAIRKLYGNCTEIVQKIYRKCAKICNNSNNEPVSTNELLKNLAHFLYIFCTISVQFPYGTHFLYVFCMFSVRSFFIGDFILHPPNDKSEVIESPLLAVSEPEVRRCNNTNNETTEAELELKLVEKLLQKA